MLYFLFCYFSLHFQFLFTMCSPPVPVNIGWIFQVLHYSHHGLFKPKFLSSVTNNDIKQNLSLENIISSLYPAVKCSYHCNLLFSYHSIALVLTSTFISFPLISILIPLSLCLTETQITKLTSLIPREGYKRKKYYNMTQSAFAKIMQNLSYLNFMFLATLPYKPCIFY